MAFVKHGVEGVADFVGDVGAKITGADDVIAAQEQASEEARRQAELTRQTSQTGAQGLRDALGTAQATQQQGFDTAMGFLQPGVDRGNQYSQQLQQLLGQGPQQFTGPNSQYRDRMMSLLNQNLDPRSSQTDQLMNQGPSELRGDILSQIQSGQPVSQELQDLISSPLELGRVEDSRGYESMRQARQEGLRDLSTQMGGLGKFFSGSTADAAGNISGRLMQDLERQDYDRSVYQRESDILNRFELDREQYGRGQDQLSHLLDFEGQRYDRGQNRLKQLLEQEGTRYDRGQTLAKQLADLDTQDYDRDIGLQKLNYGSDQDYLSNVTNQANQGELLSQILAQYGVNQGNLQGGQILGNEANIANILTGGQASSANLIGQAGQGNVNAAQTASESRGDLIGGLAGLLGLKGLPKFGGRGTNPGVGTGSGGTGENYSDDWMGV